MVEEAWGLTKDADGGPEVVVVVPKVMRGRREPKTTRKIKNRKELSEPEPASF